MTAQVRKFDSGATRDLDLEKYDYDGFLSPLVLEAYAAYMHKNRKLKDGTLRASDNWKAGIPLDVYMKSEWRHHFDLWKLHHGLPARESIEEALCGLLFNVSGYLHEYLKARDSGQCPCAEATCVEAWEPGCGLGLYSPEDIDGPFVPGYITARVPPFTDDDEPGSLKAGEAYREHADGAA